MGVISSTLSRPTSTPVACTPQAAPAKLRSQVDPYFDLYRGALVALGPAADAVGNAKQFNCPAEHEVIEVEKTFSLTRNSPSPQALTLCV